MTRREFLKLCTASVASLAVIKWHPRGPVKHWYTREVCLFNDQQQVAYATVSAGSRVLLHLPMYPAVGANRSMFRWVAPPGCELVTRRGERIQVTGGVSGMVGSVSDTGIRRWSKVAA